MDTTATLAIRPIRGSDLEALAAFYRGLGVETLRARYFVAASPFAAGPIDHLVTPDGFDRITLVAETADGRGIIAEAMSIRSDLDTELADAAIVVADAWHGRGIGRRLIARLAAEAWETGVRRWRVQRLSTNERVAALFSAAGMPGAVLEEAGVADTVYRLFPPGGGETESGQMPKRE